MIDGLVSIIMPSWNTAKFIEETIDSVIAQTYTNWELLIVDDCSTDNTDEIVGLCSDKKSFDKADAIKKIKKWMKEDFGAFNIETHYSQIKPHITCEQYLGDCIIDYKFFCFNGKPEYIYVSSDLIHDRQAQIGFFYLDGTKMPLIRNDYAPMDIENLPKFFAEMKKAAEILCKDFPFVRVDFFYCK